MYSSKSRNGISTSVVITAIVIIVVVVIAGVYVAFSTVHSSTSKTTTTATSNATTSAANTESSIQSSSTQTSTTSLIGENITIELPSPSGNLDPFESIDNRWPQSMIYETPFAFNGTSNIPIPWLATGYTMSSNGQVWTITLRQGISFSDGTPFNATAIKLGIDNLIISDSGPSSNTFASFIRGGTAFLRSNMNAANVSQFENNDGISVLSTYQVQFNLSSPQVSFLSYLSLPYYGFYISPTALANNGGIVPKSGSTWLESHSDGTGPYVLSSYNSATGTVVLRANTHWWASSAFGLKQQFHQITFNVVSNIATEELDMRTGRADFIALPTTSLYDFANRTTWLTNSSLVSAVEGTSVWGPYIVATNYVFALNSGIHLSSGSVAAVQPFQNQYMVDAFNYAWNETNYIQNDLSGLGVANPSIMLQGQLGYTTFSSYYPYNLTLAKQDIVKACLSLGCSASNPLQITLVGYNDQDAEAAGALLASNINSLQAGVNVVFEPSPTPTSVFLSKTWGIFIGELGSSPADPLAIPLQTLGTPSGLWGAFSDFTNSTVISMINQAATMVNQSQRELLYQQIDQAMAQTGHYIKVAQFEEVYVTSSRIAMTSFNEWTSVQGYPSIFALVAA